MTRLYNYVPNPGGEGATASLENESGATVAIVSTTATNWPYRGTKSYSINASGTGLASARLRLVDRPANSGAVQWHARAKFRAATGNTGTRRFRLALVDYSAAPGATEGTPTVIGTTDVDLPPGAIIDVAAQGISASGALSVGLYVQRLNGVLGAATGDILHVDDLLLSQWDGSTTPVYADGDFPAWAWSGAANASTSYTAIATPVLTLHLPAPEDDFAPWVEVLLTELWPKAVTATVQRTTDGRTMDVRGGVARAAASGFSVPDTEPGFGVPSSYRVQMFDGAGASLGFSDPAQITVNETSAWLQQPLNPSLAVRVKVAVATADSVSRPTPGTLTPTSGGRLPRWIGGRRQGVIGLRVELLVRSTAAADTVQRMLGDYEDEPYPPILLLRVPPPLRIPRVLFADFSDLTEVAQAVHLEDGVIRFVSSVTEVLPPFPGLSEPIVTYDDLDAFYDTYDAMDAGYGSYLDRDRDYSLAGYAD